jgi:hypothetical protein
MRRSVTEQAIEHLTRREKLLAIPASICIEDSLN